MSRQATFVLALVFLAAAGLFLMTRATPEPASGAATREATGPPAAPETSRGAAETRGTSPEAPAADAPRSAASPAAASAPASVPRPRNEPPPDAVTLTIETDVPGAQVFIDRQFAGHAPVTKFGLTPGRHQINVTAPGHTQHVETLDLAPGPHDIVVRFNEVRLDVRTEVVHRHGVGSCRGALVATPDGLRYETDHDDAFAAPLTNFEELQVDYMEGRLRVTAQGGRRYDFTHPEGDTDRLLVFQREVNRARERLLAGGDPASR